MGAPMSQDLTPREVPPVETPYRRIQTPIPVPESIPILEQLRRYEPRSMSGQPPIVWDRADDCQVFDAWGNAWLDWSSGVLVANAGHNHPKIARAMIDQIESGLVHNYCFPSALRGRLAEKLANLAPEGLDKVFLLTTGAEAVECAMKLARTQGRRLGGDDRITIVTFENAFHGRTLGAQMAGGIPSLKEWIVNLDPAIVQVPFPDGFRGGADASFDVFLRSLDEQHVAPGQVAGVMSETYQGGNASFAPPEYMQKLRAWCDRHGVVLILDEVQAGFGRTGAFWGFEHYGIVPDLICCGKGISSGMPLSAVIGRAELMDLYPPGSMTSTHTGNPVCAAAALANLDVIAEEDLVENAREMGQILQSELRRIGAAWPQHVGAVHGKGLVAALHMVKPGGAEPDAEMAARIVMRSVEKGLMMFAPVGYAGASVKISPPLTVAEEPLREGIAVLEEVMKELIG
ncbi:MAG: aspartate aminotransferase family protein [Pirellulales bacterium]|nr:aspartate aminotransferase family protein [Pirellulales bacterium]